MKGLEVGRAYKEGELRKLGTAHLGDCLGVFITPRPDHEPLIQLLVEDDENWFPKDITFSSFWIDDLIDMLELAQKECAP